MAKGGGNNLLRLSGLIFAVMGGHHLLRYATRGDFEIVRLTYFGSLLAGIALVALAVACFRGK